VNLAFVYPPYVRDGRFPHLSQNRQTRFTKSTLIKIYPLVPAGLVTLVERRGHKALLLDAINRRLTREQYEKQLADFHPDAVVIESKTPIMTALWREVARIKELLPGAAVVLVGDHVTARPRESFEKCACDYVVLGGDYDYVTAELVDALAKGAKLPRGVVSRDGGDASDVPLVENLDMLPFPDRELSRWRDYGEAYLHMPAMYVLSGRGCGRRGAGHPGCAFCSWQHNLWRGRARLRSPGNYADELTGLVARYRVKEFFDDNESGGLWDRDWTMEFCGRVRAAGLHKRVSLSCNARADALSSEICGEIRKSGFRLLKVGLESASDDTLGRISKGESVEEIRAGIKRAKDHGLRVLMTVMVGYPWETEEDVRRTFELVRELLTYKARMGDSLQASIVVPYPGTPLHDQAAENGWNVVAPVLLSIPCFPAEIWVAAGLVARG
jgi:anaerobic magnesium-protoporphyrin IX monomethyl ester cyclase